MLTNICGILFAKNFDFTPVNTVIEYAYEFQKLRGQNGYGFCEVMGDKISLKRFTEESDALIALKKSKSSEILFHHRAPTSTKNNVKSNHPIATTDKNYKYNYYFIHNGIISNDNELKKEHEKLGIEYTTIVDDKFNDSEALMHELILVIEGIKKPEEFSAKGSLAFIMLQTDKNNKATALYFGRYGNPLKLIKLENSITLRSAGGYGEEISENILFKFDYTDRKITEQPIKFGEIWYRKYTPQIKLLPSANSTVILAKAMEIIYDSHILTDNDFTELNDDDLIILLVLAKRIRRKSQLEMESKLIEYDDKSLEIFAEMDYERSIKNIQIISEFMNKEYNSYNIYD